MAQDKDKRKKKKSRAWIGILIAVLVIGIAAGGLYYVYQRERNFYATHFFPGTTICGFDEGDRTIPEALMDIQSIMPSYSMTVTDVYGEETITGDEFSLGRPTAATMVESLLENQDETRWFALKDKNDINMDISLSFDEIALRKRIDQLACLNDQVAPEDAYYTQDENGTYYIVPSVAGSTFDTDTVKQEILDQVLIDMARLNTDPSLRGAELAGTYVIGEEAYERPAVLETDTALVQTVEAYNVFYGRQVEIDLEDATETLYLSEVADLSDNFEILLDYDRIEQYVKRLSKKYDTYGTVRTFTDAKGNVVTAGGNKKDTFGYVLDEEETAWEIYEDLLHMEEPKTKVTAWWITYGSGRNEKTADFGENYIVIDISKQSILVVKEGKILIDDQVISGMDSDESRRTPEGVFEIWKKDQDTYLQGPDWYCHVDYWMPFTWEGDGLHDADWKQEGEFGGSTYVEQGSHGCVNLRKEVAKTIFEEMEVGTPVIIYRSQPLNETTD